MPAPPPFRLDWAGRTFAPGGALPEGSTQLLRRYPGRGAPQRVIAGDALVVAGALAAEGRRFDVAYVDPPYASGVDYHVAEASADGRGRTRRAKAYVDSWKGAEGIAAYLDHLAPRLEGAARLLGPAGTLWVHVDWRANYLLRAILDEIFGVRGFRNEIVWKRAPNLGRQAKSGQFGRTLDTLLVYGHEEARLVPPLRPEPIAASMVRFDDEGRPFTTAPRGDYTDASVARLAAEGRILRTASGKVYVKYFVAEGPDGGWVRERPVDALWTDIAPLRHRGRAEKTGYPTQKPEALLARVIAASTPDGGRVVDLFAGSGTTLIAAHALGREAVVGDFGAVPLAFVEGRAAARGIPLSVETTGVTAPPARVHFSEANGEVTARGDTRLVVAGVVDEAGVVAAAASGLTDGAGAAQLVFPAAPGARFALDDQGGLARDS